MFGSVMLRDVEKLNNTADGDQTMFFFYPVSFPAIMRRQTVYYIVSLPSFILLKIKFYPEERDLFNSADNSPIFLSDICVSEGAGS